MTVWCDKKRPDFRGIRNLLKLDSNIACEDNFVSLRESGTKVFGEVLYIFYSKCGKELLKCVYINVKLVSGKFDNFVAILCQALADRIYMRSYFIKPPKNIFLLSLQNKSYKFGTSVYYLLKVRSRFFLCPF